MHFYPHHVGDYRRDTSALSVTEHGVYRLLLDEMYVTERPLPADHAALFRIVRAQTKAERDAVIAVADLFFTKDGEMLRHTRVEREMSAFRERSELAAEKGRRSGQARRAKREKARTAVEPQLNRSSTPVEPGLNYPVPNNQEPREEASASSARERGRVAQEIVSLYPGNGNRHEAATAILRAVESGEDMGMIRESVKLHAQAWRNLPESERRFCPGLRTYFNECRWKDDPSAHPWRVIEQRREKKLTEMTPAELARHAQSLL